MDPETHVIINLDCKALPFPGKKWSVENKNYIETKDIATVRKIMNLCKDNPKVKSVSIDTINLYLAYKEYNDRKKMSFDNWRDVANDIIELTDMCNNVLRDDQVAYIFGHTELITDIDGMEKKVLAVIGKKSRKQQPEGFFPVCLFTKVEFDTSENKFLFETKANRSSAKTPIGMFDKSEIPNSLKLVDTKIREYYGI